MFDTDEAMLLDEFRAWIRERIAANWERPNA
jgi:hypothetical protein